MLSAHLYFSVPRKFKTPADWNNLPVNIRYILTLGMFMLTLRWIALVINEAVIGYTYCVSYVNI